MARSQSGWVKLHRKIEDSDIAHNYLLLGLWVTLLQWANYKETRIEWQGLPRKLKKGEILTSLTELAEFGGVDRRTASRWIFYLEQRESISIEKSPRGSKLGMIISIRNYEKYNNLDAVGSHDDVHEHVHDGPMTMYTYKEGKNIRTKEAVNPVFEKVYSLYPKKINKEEGFNRLQDQQLSDQDLLDLELAVSNYARYCNLPWNDWYHPRNFEVWCGAKSKAVKPWRSWIHPDPSLFENKSSKSNKRANINGVDMNL